MEKLQKDFAYLDGMWLRKEQLIQLAMNVGSYPLAEHYLCALLADAVVKGRRDVLLDVNKVREHYGVKAIPLGEDDLENDEDMNGRSRHMLEDEQARKIYLTLSREDRLDVLRRSMNILLSDYHLFIYARHWLAIFMVVRDRLVGESLKKTTFISLACEITPDGLPEKLRMCENAMKNFSREISDADRGEVYYKMKRNPQQLLCDTFWDIVKETILTNK